MGKIDDEVIKCTLPTLLLVKLCINGNKKKCKMTYMAR